MYKLKEIYYTLQGEGFYTGRPAVFVRFTGCNLWSGLEKDRESAICSFCDTDFWGMDGENGGKYNEEQLIEVVLTIWKDYSSSNHPFVVFTGGEPALQLDKKLVNTLKKNNIEIAIETNGTLPLPEEIDWICVSPKANTELVITKGNELKLVYPQKGLRPKDFVEMAFDYFYLQPMDNPAREENTRKAVQYCQRNPNWKLSLQTHKILGIK